MCDKCKDPADLIDNGIDWCPACGRRPLAVVPSSVVCCPAPEVAKCQSLY